MRIRTAYTSVIVALVCYSPAHAAKNEEVIRYPSLLMLGGVSQSLGASFSLAQHNRSGASSTSSTLKERYSLSTAAAILDPHLVNMQIMAGVSYSQQFGTLTSTLLDWDYNITASAFDMSYHPLTVTTSRTSSIITNGYLPTYTVTNNNNIVSGALLNSKVPLLAYYAHNTSETDGLPENSTSSADAVGIALHHELADTSVTNFSLSTAGTRSGDSSSSGYTVTLSNSLSLDEAKRYRLTTNLSGTDTESSGVPQRNVALSADLSCGFGKALFGSFGERFNYNSTRNFEDQDQTQRNNTVSASLSHRLYQSLLTSVALSASTGSSLGGETSSYSGSGSVTYTKRLPAQSNLTLTVNSSRTVSSQDFQTGEVAVRDEPHLNVNWGDFIKPDVVGTLAAVVSVTSLDGVFDYVEDVDYRVDLALGHIEILTGGGIVPGTGIALSYRVRVNEEISYQTDAVTTSALVSLLGGRYTLGGTYSVNDQSIVSGEATNEALVSSTSVSLRADANFTPTLFGVEYRGLDSSQEKSSTFGAYVSHSLRTSKDGVIAFTLRETYAMMETTAGGGADLNQNILSATASYSRRLFGWLSFNTSVAANDSRSRDSYSDFISVRGSLSGGYNRLQFSLAAQTLYRISGSADSLDNNLTCSVTRFF